MTDFDAYQQWTRETAIYPQAESGSLIAVAYVALGVANEGGELAGKIKKWIRDGITYDELVEEVTGEAGDVLWYLARILDELGISLGAVAVANQRKLLDRKTRGVIGGSGDKR